MATKATAQATIADLNDIIASDIAPLTPALDMLWCDTSDSPPALKRWDGVAWLIVNDFQPQIDHLTSTITQTAGQIAQCVSKGDMSRYLTFDAVNGVQIGDTATSYKVQILSDRVNILQNGRVIAYFASSKLFITDGELTNSLTIGYYSLKRTLDGGIAIG